MTTPYPPTHHLSTTPISPSTALSHLTAYLTATAHDASLHPNALLTENGPITPSSGANTGLVLHNLKRVEAGLRGEYLGTDRTVGGYGGEGVMGVDAVAVAGADEAVEGVRKGKGKDIEGKGEWQDKEEFEREQDMVQGEVGRRDNAVEGGVEEEGGHVPEVKSTISKEAKKARKQARRDKSDGASESKVGLNTEDKKARKQAKKEKRKKQRTDNLVKKTSKKNAET